MAIAFLNGASASSATATVAVTLSVTAGNFIAVVVSGGGFSSFSSLTDNQGNTYTAASGNFGISTGYARIFYTNTTITASTVITATFGAAANITIVAQQFSGIFGLIDQTAQATGTSQSPLVTLSGNNATAVELVIAADIYTASAGGEAAGTGFLNLTQINTGSGWYSGMASRVTSVVEQTTAGFSLTSSVAWSIAAVAFKPLPPSTITGIGTITGLQSITL